MYLNQYKQNKNDSINNNNGDNSKNNKNDDGNTIIITVIIIIVIIINSLFQPGDFSAGSTTGYLLSKTEIFSNIPEVFPFYTTCFLLPFLMGKLFKTG